jgi:hypothetical protein
MTASSSKPMRCRANTCETTKDPCHGAPLPQFARNLLDCFAVRYELQGVISARSTQAYQQNYPLFVQRYPNGLPPYIVGTSVIS